YYRQLRMSKQELREEQRQYEASPELKGRIRRVQYEMVHRRMLQEVPTADVVLANPTHVAVALRYDRKAGGAPVMVAKGADLMSEKIKKIARAHNVPVLTRPSLARTIYASTDVGEPIGPELFVAVAEVLAMIYRTRRGALR
ncbi:MAG: flagellar biosynthetic protein FlhB, partial [bacterium]|nr:flagellar biosynthetic protein FlhB [bacterium]